MGYYFDNLQWPNSSKMPVGYPYDRYLDRKEFLGQGQLCPSKNSSCLGHKRGGGQREDSPFTQVICQIVLKFVTLFLC